MESQQPQFTPIPVLPEKASSELLTQQARKLEEMGFARYEKNLKLLLKTGGDFEAVLNFLEAKTNLRNSIKKEKVNYSAQKDLKKKEKREKKDKEEKKKEKREKKEFRKKEKGAKKEKKLKEHREKKDRKLATLDSNVALLHLPSAEAWPADVSHLFLDGNNMLYVCAPIRNMVLHGKFRQAEETLRDFAKEVASLLKVPHCTLVFDQLHSALVEGGNFVVCGARPKYSTSDDFLVEWSEQVVPASGVFVTSDVELIGRLAKNGARICKPKEWFQFGATLMKKVIPFFQTCETLDDFMTAWLGQREELDRKSVV